MGEYTCLPPFSRDVSVISNTKDLTSSPFVLQGCFHLISAVTSYLFTSMLADTLGGSSRTPSES